MEWRGRDSGDEGDCGCTRPLSGPIPPFPVAQTYRPLLAQSFTYRTSWNGHTFTRKPVRSTRQERRQYHNRFCRTEDLAWTLVGCI